MKGCSRYNYFIGTLSFLRYDVDSSYTIWLVTSVSEKLMQSNTIEECIIMYLYLSTVTVFKFMAMFDFGFKVREC